MRIIDMWCGEKFDPNKHYVDYAMFNDRTSRYEGSIKAKGDVNIAVGDFSYDCSIALEKDLNLPEGFWGD
jgi:hypothetical protein